MSVMESWAPTGLAHAETSPGGHETAVRQTNPEAPVRDRTADWIAAFLAGFSIELTPGEAARTAAFGDHLRPGTKVYITFVPGSDFDRVIATARRLRDHGMVPVPHLAARSTPNRRWLDDNLKRLAWEAGVDEVLVVGGGGARPVGDYQSTVELLQTGLFDTHGITRIGVAGHPEGSKDIGGADLAAALADKNALARRSDARFYILTQFCFQAAPVIAWDKAIRAAGNRLPIHVGLPGCATLKTLIRYAAICGVGASIGMLSSQARRISRLVKTATPDRLVLDLAHYQATDPDCGIQCAHFFPFGALERTATWAYGARDGQVSPTPAGGGFDVAGFR